MLSLFNCERAKTMTRETQTTNNINNLKARVGDLERQLREARERLIAAQIEATGISVGDIVTSRGSKFRVTKIEPSFDKAWLSGNPLRKDGSYGTAVRNLYSDWEKTA